MKWVAISGSWRHTNKKIEKEVRKTVREIILKGDGIVSGGALGVDYFALDEAMRLDPACQKVKIFLLTTLNIYKKHLLKRAKEKIISLRQAKELIDQLACLKKINPKALTENGKNKMVNKKTYYERNSEVVAVADKLIAFQVNASQGVQDTIDKAEQKGIPVRKFTYSL